MATETVGAPIEGWPSGRAVLEVVRAQPRVQYSALAGVGTRLPDGVRPAYLLPNRTGALLVGDRVAGVRSPVERLVEGSMQYIERVAEALPIDEHDESVVGTLIAKRVATLAVRPLRRREGERR
jgi:hypothetical protein